MFAVHSFRHLWISDALMAGSNIATVAYVAGMSVAMIERVYGHFMDDQLHAAQARIDAVRDSRIKRRMAELD